MGFYKFIQNKNKELSVIQIKWNCKNKKFVHFSEWDAEWPGPQVIIEVSEKAPNTNGTGAEGNARNW